MQQLSAEDHLSFTKMIMGILNSWGLNARQQHTFLAFSRKVPVRGMRRFQEDRAFPDEEALNQRIEHIVGIHHALYTSYPHNPAMGPIWLRTSNKRFNNQSPLKVMMDEGVSGIVRIRAHLDCTYDWHINR